EKAETPASFMQAAEETARAEGLGTNYAFFIGHGALRAKAMGYSDAKPTEAQMNCMKENLKQAMEAGFLGYSSGLVYAPSVYGDAEELTELAKVMAPYNGIYASHIRSEGDRELAAVQEAITVGEGAGCKVLISHFKVIGMHNEGRSAQLLAALDQAWAKGVQVYADQYPYTAGSAPLLAQIPPKYLVGGTAEALKRLKDPQLRKEILHSILHETEEFDGGIYYGGFERVLVVEARKTPQLENKTLAQIAEEQGKEPMDAYCDLLLENDGIAQGVYFTQVPSDMIRLMADSRVFCGSDWSDFAAPVDPNTEGGSHPRAVSTTVRRLELVRDFRLRTMEESIKNITYDTAQAMGLTGIGLLKEGWPADIAVIDYDALHARADFVHPYRRNDGVHYVLVSGKLAVENGTVTGVRAGRILKRG
ncbi:MAG: amidohydrolase family protein, partial [Firmicutes bacterium]|nr:amidohydrolase family protein [Bacillota bacterium]